MRLSALQRQVLTQTARDCFDPDVRVRLFGSRTDDTRKGGDIDLLIETQLQDLGQIARAHSQFLARLHLALGEQKIDVLIDYPDRQIQVPTYMGPSKGCCCERASRVGIAAFLAAMQASLTPLVACLETTVSPPALTSLKAFSVFHLYFSQQRVSF